MSKIDFIKYSFWFIILYMIEYHRSNIIEKKTTLGGGHFY